MQSYLRFAELERVKQDQAQVMGYEDKTESAAKRPQSNRLALTVVLVIGAAVMQPSARVVASDGNVGIPNKPAPHATLKSASATSPDIPFIEFDSESEGQLLDLANRSRAQTGAPRLALDAGMSKAARTHAAEMFTAHELSHQLPGELSLSERLAAFTRTQLDQEGENVALDFDAAQAHQHLMLSPHHRENLLNPDYNVIGLGVIRSGNRLYVVQDFGHALSNYSLTEVKDRIAAAVAQMRHQVNQPAIERRDFPSNELPAVDDAACSMAQADRLGTSPIHHLVQRYTVLTYTSLHPETLPGNTTHLLGSHNLRSFSVGACYARTETYPTGVYWVVLALD